jgi:VCBS repeat-containing protein
MASKASFDKTPQAGDDSYSSAATGLTEDSSAVLRLDVLANDKGGSAKKLYSLDDGNNPGDLLSKDAPGAAGDFSAHGARIWITTEGTVAYDSSTWSAAFKAELQHLAPGEFLQDSFTYAIQLGNGALSWATVTLQIAGTDDAPAITSGAQAGSVKEDESLTASGQVTASDPDHGDHPHFAVVGGGTGAYGSLGLGANGVWTYTLNQGASVDALAEGEQKAELFTVRVTDDYGAHADQQVTVTVTGTNDAAAISGDDTGAVAEATAATGGTPTASGDLLATDVDNANDVFQAASGAAAYGTYSVAADGAWIYSLDNGNAAVDALNDGQQLSDSFTAFSADGTAHVVGLTIQGASDAGFVGGDGPDNITGDADGNLLLGNGGNDTLAGRAGEDSLFGGDGNDVLQGGGGTDLMVGGAGSDTFHYASLDEAVDLVQDFTTGAGGDVLDLHEMLQGFSGYDGTNAFSGGYLFFLPNSGDTIVLVDPDGGFDSIAPLALLQGATLTAADTGNYVL